MRLWVRPDLGPVFDGLDFEQFLALGEVPFKASPDGRRRTARFERGGRAFFVKAHLGTGWREIAKCALQGKRAVLDARPEVAALERCRTLGLSVPALAAWGFAGHNPATRRSFVITEELADAERLSTYLAARAPLSFRSRRALTVALARLVARLHGDALAHRDLYLEHVFVRAAGESGWELSLLDLHRAVRGSPQAHGWRVKDLTALYRSARRSGATRTDAARFLGTYLEHDPRSGSLRALWQRCARRGVAR